MDQSDLLNTKSNVFDLKLSPSIDNIQLKNEINKIVDFKMILIYK